MQTQGTERFRGLSKVTQVVPGEAQPEAPPLTSGSLMGERRFCSAKETEETLLYLPLILVLLGLRTYVENGKFGLYQKTEQRFLRPPSRGERDLCSWT